MLDLAYRAVCNVLVGVGVCPVWPIGPWCRYGAGGSVVRCMCECVVFGLCCCVLCQLVDYVTYSKLDIFVITLSVVGVTCGVGVSQEVPIPPCGYAHI